MEDWNERDAFGVREYCERHGFSTGFLYALWRRGLGPRFMQQGDRRFISREAAADYRREMETATGAGSSSIKAGADRAHAPANQPTE